MARTENQKLKAWYITKILTERTSEGDGITMPELIAALAEYGISAERKSLYSDIRSINEFGEYIRVESYKQGGNTYYYAVGSILNLSDLKLLADVLAASKFISEKQIRELIGKMSRLTSAKKRRELNRNVYIRRHATEENDEGFANIEPLQRAIREKRQIRFEYLQWKVNGSRMELVPRDGSPREHISPFWLIYNDENYYLVAYDGAKKGTRTFRVDKMRNVEVTPEPIEGAEVVEKLDPHEYAEARFEMFDGTSERVRICCPRRLVGALIDKLGRDEISVFRNREDEETVELSFRIVPNDYFLCWLLALDRDVRILSPESCVQRQKELCQRIAERS